MAEETKTGNLIVDNQKELDTIAALEILERYCLDMRAEDKCSSCVIALMLDPNGNGECPFRQELQVDAPGDWEIRESLYNSGMMIFNRQDWDTIRASVSVV